MKIVVVLTVLFISIVSSSISAVIFTVYPDYLYFGGTFLGSGIGDNDDLECLLALLKFTVSKVDRVLSNP